MISKKYTKYRYWAVIIIIVLTVVLYIIELLTSEPIFDVTSFSLNYVVSFPFILLSIIINWGVAVLMNKPMFQKQKIFIKIATSSISTVLIAGFLVAIGNLPFISDMSEFIKTVSFWKSVAATTLLNVILLVAIDYMIQSIINRNLQKENAILQYKQLKSQINPHFLFNSLNVLISTINKDKEAAVKYTKRLSAVYRYVLTQDSQDIVTVKEEVDFINNYIGILRARFNKGLEFRFNISPDDMFKSLPPMSLQLLIENAVKHNAILPEDPLVINIYTDHTNLIVSNNLKPRMSCNDDTGGIGLKNLSEKYAIIAGADISVFKDSNTYTVKLPLL